MLRIALSFGRIAKKRRGEKMVRNYPRARVARCSRLKQQQQLADWTAASVVIPPQSNGANQIATMTQLSPRVRCWQEPRFKQETKGHRKEAFPKRRCYAPCSPTEAGAR